jgi:RIO kinase 1
MSSERFLDKKSLKKLDRELQSILSKTGTLRDRKTEDEVFDKTTLHVLEKIISDRVIDILDFPISTGKEGNIFRGITPDKKYVAVKIYRTNTSTFKHLSQYIIGDPRFKSVQKTRRGLVYAWTKKEFKNLERAKKVGVKVPHPILFKKNVLVMEYIGSSSRPAPMLKDVDLKNPNEIYHTLIDFITKMYKKAEMVHGDISAFNVLMHEDKPYLIDLGQGVLLDHPNSDEFLKRDIKNIISYFKKFGIQTDEKKIYNNLIKKS